MRVLKKEDGIFKRGFVKHVTPGTLSWMERFGESYGGSPARLPSHLQSSRVEETFNLYENQVIALQLIELQALLQRYMQMDNSMVREKASQYRDWVAHWKKAGFL